MKLLRKYQNVMRKMKRWFVKCFAICIFLLFNFKYITLKTIAWFSHKFLPVFQSAGHT